MTSLPELVSDSVTDATATASLPPRIADRAIVQGGRRRRRQRAAMVCAVALLAVVALVVPLATLTRQSPTPPANPTAENAIFATQRDRQWRILDPETGAYRDAPVGSVSAPTADLRAVAVTPSAGGRRVGRYETTTGTVRWYTVPFSPEDSSVSPDGRYLLASADLDDFTGLHVALVDLTTGQVRTIDLPRGGSSAAWTAAQEKSRYSHAPTVIAPVTWHPDSHHLVIGRMVVGLDGRQTGTIHAPGDDVILALRRGGGALAVPKRSNLYTVVDNAGEVVRRIAIDATCRHRSTPCPPSVPFFVGWRGPDEILLSGAEQDPRSLTALDLRDGSRQVVTTRVLANDVVITAERLSPQARERVAF